MDKVPANPSGGKFFWFFQRFSGLALVIILVVHIYCVHFTITGESLTYSEVMRRMGDPYWKTLDLLFLYLALFHGLNGVWTVITDYFHRAWLKITFFSLVISVAMILAVLGTLTILSLPTY